MNTNQEQDEKQACPPSPSRVFGRQAPAILVILVTIIVLGFLVWIFWILPQGQEAIAPELPTATTTNQ